MAMPPAFQNAYETIVNSIVRRNGVVLMAVMVVEVDNALEQAFKEIVEKRLGKGEKSMDLAVNTLLEKWIRKYG